MSNNLKALKWLYGELPNLVTKGIIDEEGAAKIKTHYGALPKTSTLPMALIITGILGAVLIGAGIILIFGYNWENFTLNQRTVLSFLPLIVAQMVYGYTFFRKRNDTGWVESSSIFLMLMLASSLALISQTYHVDGELEDFLFTWILLSIPLLYLMNASLPAMLLMILSTWWAGLVVDFQSYKPIYYWLFFLAFLPHLIYHLKDRKTEIREVLLGWVFVVSFGIAMIFVFASRNIADHYLIGIAAITPLVYLLGKYVHGHGATIWQRPLQTASIAMTIGVSLFFAYGIDWKEFRLEKIMTAYLEAGSLGILNLVFVIACFVGTISLASIRFSKKQQTNPFLLIFPVLVLIMLGAGMTFSKIAFNVFLLGFSIFYIKEGLNTQKLSLINVGMLILSLLIGMRFFDVSIPFMIKGIVFIIIGICFLTANVYLSKKYKSNEH